MGKINNLNFGGNSIADFEHPLWSILRTNNANGGASSFGTLKHICRNEISAQILLQM